MGLQRAGHHGGRLGLVERQEAAVGEPGDRRRPRLEHRLAALVAGDLGEALGELEQQRHLRSAGDPQRRHDLRPRRVLEGQVDARGRVGGRLAHHLGGSAGVAGEPVVESVAQRHELLDAGREVEGVHAAALGQPNGLAGLDDHVGDVGARHADHGQAEERRAVHDPGVVLGHVVDELGHSVERAIAVVRVAGGGVGHVHDGDEVDAEVDAPGVPRGLVGVEGVDLALLHGVERPHAIREHAGHPGRWRLGPVPRQGALHDAVGADRVVGREVGGDRAVGQGRSAGVGPDEGSAGVEGHPLHGEVDELPREPAHEHLDHSVDDLLELPRQVHGVGELATVVVGELREVDARVVHLDERPVARPWPQHVDAIAKPGRGLLALVEARGELHGVGPRPELVLAALEHRLLGQGCLPSIDLSDGQGLPGGELGGGDALLELARAIGGPGRLGREVRAVEEVLVGAVDGDGPALAEHRAHQAVDERRGVAVLAVLVAVVVGDRVGQQEAGHVLQVGGPHDVGGEAAALASRHPRGCQREVHLVVGLAHGALVRQLRPLVDDHLGGRGHPLRVSMAGCSDGGAGHRAP